MTHVKHLGFENELVVERIWRALIIISESERDLIVEHLKPADIQRAVKDMLSWREPTYDCFVCGESNISGTKFWGHVLAFHSDIIPPRA